MEIDKLNIILANKSPQDIVKWALDKAKKPIITTNFRPYEVAILDLITKIKNDINVIWCDTGYNTKETYQHAQELITKLNLNIDLYVPKQTVAYRESVIGIPHYSDSTHQTFVNQVKLEPFRRAMKEHKPDLWFTNLRKGQTTFRDSIGILSYDTSGTLKVSPFYHYSDEDLDKYLNKNELPNEFKYYDPTKQLDSLECGLHK